MNIEERINFYLNESKKYNIEVSLRKGNVNKAFEILRDRQIPFEQEASNYFVFKNEEDYDEALELLKMNNIEIY